MPSLCCCVKIFEKDAERERERGRKARWCIYDGRFQINLPSPVESIKMNNPLFRKQAKVDFNANHGVRGNVYPVDSGVLHSQEERTRDSGPTLPLCTVTLQKVLL